MGLWEELVDISAELGATIGVTDLAPFPEEEERILRRTRDGMHGGLSFTYAHPHTASHPLESFPWASSIVVVAVPYLREGDGDGERAVARFASGDRYSFLREVLGQLEAALRSAGNRTEVVYDDNRLIDRAVAVRAGIAWRGKSTMVLTPGSGPWTLLGSVVTDAALHSTEPMRRSCGTCDVCIPACPTDAIIAPGVLDARRCISAVLQRRGSIDPELRSRIGGRVYGCDECLTACPPGHPTLRIRSDHEHSLTATEILLLDDETLESLVHHWYVPSRRMRFVRRNALVALGNTGDASSLDLLATYLGSDDELLVEHAAWAIGQIGGERAASICRDVLATTESEALQRHLLQAIAVSERRGAYADTALEAPSIDPEESIA